MPKSAPTLVFSARSVLARLTDDLEVDPRVDWILDELDEASRLLEEAQKMLASAEVS